MKQLKKFKKYMANLVYVLSIAFCVLSVCDTLPFCLIEKYLDVMENKKMNLYYCYINESLKGVY